MKEKRDAKFYQRQLDLAKKEERKWRDRVKKIIKTYRDEENESGPSKFNILWSNTQTQLPALYSARPKPDVRRRWRGPNPVAREVSTAIERALEFSMDTYDFDRLGEKLVLDALLAGRMVARVRYHPFTEPREIEKISDEESEDAEQREDGMFVSYHQYDEVVYEEVRCYHVPYDKYRQSPADCWADVWWVAYGDNFLTKEEIQEQFGDEFDDVPLTHSDSDDDGDESVMKAQVWELWDKEAKKVVAVVEGYDKLLMKHSDELKLQGFFPQPEPTLLIETPDSLIPIPEYTMYQYQAEELNTITQRISKLVDAMKVKGFYPGEDVAKMQSLMASDENILVPVDGWAAYAEKGGLKGMIDWMPIKEIVDVWQKLVIQREQLMQQIYELIGISDIQRGSSDPRETRGAQELKANFGGRRLRPKQQRIQRFFRDILRIKAEIIAEHFDPKTLQMMTGTEVTMEMRAIMRSDALRSFNIDIETDSTVAPDEEMEKRGVAEFLSAMSNYLGQVMPLVQSQPAAVVPLGKILLWMTRKFKMARDVEQEVEDFIQAFQKMPAQNNGEAEAKMKELEQKLQIMVQEKQKKLEIEENESKSDIARKDRESQADIARKDAEARAKMQRDSAVTAADLRLDEQKGQAQVKAIGDKSKSDEKSKNNVVPMNRSIRLIKNDKGQTTSVEVVDEGGSRTIEVERA